MSNPSTFITGCLVTGIALTGIYLLDRYSESAEAEQSNLMALAEVPVSTTGQGFTCTGSCIRQQFVVPIYVASLYVDGVSKRYPQGAQALLEDSATEKILALRWLQPMNSDELRDEYNAFFADSDPDDSFDAAQQSAITQLVSHLSHRDVDEGQLLYITWEPEGYLIAGYRGDDTFVVPDLVLANAIWRALFMPSSPLNGKELVKDLREEGSKT